MRKLIKFNRIYLKVNLALLNSSKIKIIEFFQDQSCPTSGP